MKVSFSIKQRNPDTGEWRHLDVASLAGKTLRDVLEEHVDQEAVAEFIFGEERFYFTGTERWQERMARKGRSFLLSEAVDVLMKRYPRLLGEVLPGVDMVKEIFGDTTVLRSDFVGGER